MHIERPPVEAQLLGRPIVSMVSCSLCAYHWCICLRSSAVCHREPVSTSSLVHQALGQWKTLPGAGGWRKGEPRAFLTLSSARGQHCAFPAPLAPSWSLRPTLVWLAPHQASAWYTSWLLYDDEITNFFPGKMSVKANCPSLAGSFSVVRRKQFTHLRANILKLNLLEIEPSRFSSHTSKYGSGASHRSAIQLLLEKGLLMTLAFLIIGRSPI